MADPRRIVFVLPTLVGGGAERVVRAVADGLARDGRLQIELVALLDPRSDSHVTPAGVRVNALGASRVRTALPALLRLLQRERPDTVVTTLKHISVGVALLRGALPRGTRHVARVANTYSKELELVAEPRRQLERWLLRISHAKIDAFICVSEGVREDLVSCAGVDPRRCTVIRNPVDVDRIQVLATEEVVALAPAVQEARLRFLTVGRLEPQKDHATLLRAFSRVCPSLDAALIVAGSGSLLGELEALAKDLGVAERVDFVGYVENPYPLFARSDVVVLSSRFEGLPNVLLEALALGLPCVSTDCPHGPAEVLVDDRLGLLVPVGDVEAMALAMQAIGGRDLSALGPAHVRAHHSIEHVVEDYRKVLDGGR